MVVLLLVLAVVDVGLGSGDSRNGYDGSRCHHYNYSTTTVHNYVCSELFT